MALGVSPLDQSLNRAAMGFQASMLEQLGQQVRQDVRVVQTNRQLQGFAQQVQTVDPAAPDFAAKISSVMAQFPLAAQSPLGAAAINQLGAQRSFYQQQLMADRAFERQLGGIAAKDYLDKRPYGSGPVTRGQLSTVANGGTPAEPGMPVVDPAEAVVPTGQPSIPSSPINNVGAQINAFRQSLMQLPPNQRPSQELGEKLVNEYAESLMVTQKPQAPRLFPTADGRLVAATAQGATEVPMPPGMLLPTRSSSAADPEQKALIQTKAKLMADYAKAKATADAATMAWSKKNVNEKDPADVALKWDMGIKADTARAMADSLRDTIQGLSGEPGLIPAELTEPSNKKRAATVKDVDMENAKALAKKALDDPNTPEEYKAAARKILSQ